MSVCGLKARRAKHEQRNISSSTHYKNQNFGCIWYLEADNGLGLQINVSGNLSAGKTCRTDGLLIFPGIMKEIPADLSMARYSISFLFFSKTLTHCKSIICKFVFPAENTVAMCPFRNLSSSQRMQPSFGGLWTLRIHLLSHSMPVKSLFL